MSSLLGRVIGSKSESDGKPAESNAQTDPVVPLSEEDEKAEEVVMVCLWTTKEKLFLGLSNDTLLVVTKTGEVFPHKELKGRFQRNLDINKFCGDIITYKSFATLIEDVTTVVNGLKNELCPSPIEEVAEHISAFLGVEWNTNWDSDDDKED